MQKRISLLLLIVLLMILCTGCSSSIYNISEVEDEVFHLGYLTSFTVKYDEEIGNSIENHFLLDPTNATIRVTYKEGQADELGVFLCDAETDEQIQLGTVKKGGDILFTNLASGHLYYCKLSVSEESNTVVLRYSC